MIFVVIGASCRNDKPNPIVTKNDTTQVLKILIDSAFYRENLPSFSSLYRNNPFGDTIIIKFDPILVGHLPTHLKYKFLTEDEICSLATQHLSDAYEFCTFINLNSFEKVDSTYEINIQNECVMPLFKKNGKPRFDKDFYKNTGTFKCWFGLLCGGGMAMTFIKQADTLKAKIDGFWSD